MYTSSLYIPQRLSPIMLVKASNNLKHSVDVSDASSVRATCTIVDRELIDKLKNIVENPEQPSASCILI